MNFLEVFFALPNLLLELVLQLHVLIVLKLKFKGQVLDVCRFFGVVWLEQRQGQRRILIALRHGMLL